MPTNRVPARKAAPGPDAAVLAGPVDVVVPVVLAVVVLAFVVPVGRAGPVDQPRLRIAVHKFIERT